MSISLRHGSVIVALMMLNVGCSANAASGSSASAPLTLTLAPNNGLAVSATFDAPGASLARLVSTDGTHTLTSPYVAVGADGHGALSALGLSPGVGYQHSLEVYAGGSASTLASASLASAALPDAVSPIQIAVSGSLTTPMMFMMSGYGTAPIVFDRTGTIRWYRPFESTAEETKIQPDATYTTYVGTSTGNEAVSGYYARYGGDGTLIEKLTAASPDSGYAGAPTVYTDPHELLTVTGADGTPRLLMFGYVRVPRSDSDSTITAWHQLQRLTLDGQLELRWRASDHFALDDQDVPAPGIPGDIDHTNAIAVDPSDGNYVLSFRNLSALVKIDAQSGDVLWQLGGKKNQFTFVGDPLGGFSGQHSVRMLSNGHVLIYDNGFLHSPQESRAVEYALDLEAKTATMVWEYRHSPAIFTNVTGSVARLANGHTVVAFAFAGVVDEVDETGKLLWEATITNAGKVATGYRVRPIASLYAPGNP